MGSLFVGVMSLFKVLFSNDPQFVKGRAETEAYFTHKVEKYNAACDNLAVGQINLPKPQHAINNEFHKFGEFIGNNAVFIGIIVGGGVAWLLKSWLMSLLQH